MKRRIATIYATVCTLLLAAGFLLAFLFAWKDGVEATVKCLYGLFIGFLLSPILHELGHVSFALIAKMDYVFVKCFCFKIYIKNGKKRLGFASPFSPDETQALPLQSGDMKKRAILYTVGGLVYGGVFLLLILAGAVVASAVGKPSYVLWGILPYAAYLFLLNVAPFEYGNGKTDALVYIGLKKEYDAEKNMLSAMEIQGLLSEGKSFAQIDRELYYNVPQLCEDEPLFAVMLELRYRYHLERGELTEATACLNRLASVAEYMPETEFEKIAAEFVYINSLRGEMGEAEENASKCQAFLKGETATAKRVLAAWSKANGQTEFVETLLKQAEACLKNERIAGVQKFEKILLDRIEDGEIG